MKDLTEILCTRCGLCCDGTLLADAELVGIGEIAALEALGMEVEEEGRARALLPLPCRALKGTRCSIYLHRPGCCRAFECRLLQETRRGAVEVEQALATIADARSRIAHIRKLIAALGGTRERLPLNERGLETIAQSEERDDDPESERTRRELQAAMGSLDRLIHDRFLGGRSRSRPDRRATTGA
jgi:Fe-S-cluster containining protein